MIHPDISIEVPAHIKAYEDILKAAEKYMRVRKNDVHIPLSFHFALKLLEVFPEADKDVVSAAIILHDIGWYTIDEDEIYTKGFSGPNMLTSDIRFLHEEEGMRLAADLLGSLGYSEDFISRVNAIIDGHDTRKTANSLEDKIVRDSDKLWRFTVTGIGVACDWFKMTPSAYAARLVTIFDQMHLEESIQMAKEELEKSKRLLMCHVI